MRAVCLAIAVVMAASAGAAAQPQSPLERAVVAGRHWRIATAHGPVHVWAPAGYEPATAVTVLLVHGLYTTADEAWLDYQLPEQFALSGINALFVVCEAPSKAGQAVSWPTLQPLLDTVATGIDVKMPAGEIVAIGHSGGWLTLSGWLDDDDLTTVVLLDAAYGAYDRFTAWVNASPVHRLIDVGDDSRPQADLMHQALPETVTVERFPPPEAGRLPDDAHEARVLYVRSYLGHMSVLTGGVALPMILRELALTMLPTRPADAHLGELPRPIVK